MTRFTLAFTLAFVLALPAAAKVSGSYNSPLGRLRIKESGGVVTATIASKKNPCGFKRGKKVLEGTVLDDSVTGTVTACKIGGGACAGAVDGVAMLLVTQKGRVLSGAVHLETGKCKSPIKGDGISIRRRASKPKAAPTGARKRGGKKPPRDTGAAVVPKAPTKSARARAEGLATEAAAMMTSGQIEEARAKFIESVQVDPSYSQGHVGVGVTYYMRDRYEEALDHYKKGLEANPSNRDAYYNMACVYALKGDKDQALRYLNIAVLNGYVQLDTLAQDPDLKALAGAEQFEKLKRGEL